MSDAWLDRTMPVRAGEELDVPWLEFFLTQRLPDTRGPLSVEQFPSGHSNLTYLLRLGDRELVLRRPPYGAKAIKAGHDMEREWRILSRLKEPFPLVPTPLLFCPESESGLGATFYVMERVRGVILRNRLPPGLTLAPSDFRRLSESFVDTLVALHAVDWRAAGLGDIGHPEGYLARQVQGWTERYQRARTDALPEMEEVARWLAGHLPREAPPTVIHNDFKYDNLVLAPGDIAHVRAVLDWEMATVGDPLSDLGMALAYWVQADDAEEMQMLPLGLTREEGNLTREQLVERYAHASGRDVRHLPFHYVLGLFKVAVIAQQIYFRYQQGFTKDERFAPLILAVGILARQAARAAERGTVRP